MYVQLQQLLTALALGLLVGLQRERAAKRLAGLRTFALVTLSGTLAAQLAPALGPWLVVIGLLGVIAAVVTGNFVAVRSGGADPGQTTELAMLVMYLVGVYVAVGPLPLAVALGAGVAVLLHLKPALQGLVARIGDADFRAIMSFVVVSLVVLPVLPDRTFGPYHVLNPRQVWLMVVLIVGIGLAGYLAYKLLGTRGGSLLGGLLGGLISSTATTVTFARRTRAQEDTSGPAAAVILLASAVAFARVLVEIGVVAGGFFRTAALPLGLLALLFFAIAFVGWLRQAGHDQVMPEPKNPSELRGALAFAALYAGILLAVAAAREHLGSGGLYAVAVISGLTDVDAITLSTSNLVRDGGLDAGTGWRIIAIAALSNLGFKAGAVAFLGRRALLARIALGYGVVAVAGLALLLLWP